MKLTSIQFVGHEASRSGAPIALLHLMRWLKRTHQPQLSCILYRAGELIDEYRAIATTSTFPDAELTLPYRLLNRGGLREAARAYRSKRVLANQLLRPDVIYANTIASIHALELAASRCDRIVCHVHELELGFRLLTGAAFTGRLLELSRYIIACSNAVADNLIRRYHVEPKRIAVVHEYIPIPQHGDVNPDARERIRNRLGVPPGTFLVGGCGAPGWRKGTDLFVQLALAVKHLKPALPVHFVWIGGHADAAQVIELNLDIELAGLSGMVSWLPNQLDPLNWFAGFDLFVLTSREDPYPLVCLEAASCGVPIICFTDSGGMPEFIEQDSGTTVPYLDVAAMAAAVMKLLNDPQERERFGSRAREKVAQRHSVETAGPQIWDILTGVATGKLP